MTEMGLVPVYCAFGFDAGGKLLTVTVAGHTMRLSECLVQQHGMMHFADAASAIATAHNYWPRHWRVTLSYNVEERITW